jgi:hypothetical protein
LAAPAHKALWFGCHGAGRLRGESAARKRIYAPEKIQAIELLYNSGGYAQLAMRVVGDFCLRAGIARAASGGILAWRFSPDHREIDEGAPADPAKLDQPLAKRITAFLRPLSILGDRRSRSEPLKRVRASLRRCRAAGAASSPEWFACRQCGSAIAGKSTTSPAPFSTNSLHEAAVGQNGPSRRWLAWYRAWYRGPESNRHSIAATRF